MNFKILLILLTVGIVASSYGILSNEIILSVQKFQILGLPPMDGESESGQHFSTLECSCFGVDPITNEEGFDPGFCNVDYTEPPTETSPGVADPDSLGLMGNKLCLWEIHDDEYGDLLIDGEGGCPVSFWLEHSDPMSADYVWPPGYHPDYPYEDIFFFDHKKELGLYDNNNEVNGYERLLQKLNEDEIKKLEKMLEELNEDEKEQLEKILLKLDDHTKNPGKLFSRISDDKKNLTKFMMYLETDEKMKFNKIIKKIDKEDKSFFDKLIKKYTKSKGKDLTLKDALSNKFPNHKVKNILRESTAAVLNSAHSKINYPYSVPEVISITHDSVVAGKDWKEYGEELKKYNTLGNSLCS